MLGTEILIIILLWCGDPNSYRGYSLKDSVDQCRQGAIKCVSKLKNFTTDDVVEKCLVGR